VSFRLFRPLPLALTRAASALAILGWLICMGLLVNRAWLQASGANLATDLARYGTEAQWRGVYYRGEKIGFTVGQTVPQPDGGFELQEDGRLQFALLGATTPAIIKTTARVDSAFALKSFDFSLDPGTGPLTVHGALDGLTLSLEITSPAGTRRDTQQLAEPPALMLSVGRRLASAGLKIGTTQQWMIFDPATLKNAPVTVTVGAREVVTGGGRPIPAFRVEMRYAGLDTTSWITDTGEIVREESPMGLITVRETEQQARLLAVSAERRADMLGSSAVVPAMAMRIDEPRNVLRMKLRVDNADLTSPDLQGVSQRVDGNVIELIDPRTIEPAAADATAASYTRAEPFIESDAPEIKEAAEQLVSGITGTRARAERLVRAVNGMIDKKPTLSLPSALEVLRTKVGDCNEHTALYVALARALGIPARISAGLVFVRGAFYYHAWPEVYVDEGKGTGLWLPVDPTFNQFPADATHVRLARGGLDKQTAILPLIGKVRIVVVEADMVPNSTPVLVGRQADDVRPLEIAVPRRQPCGCWASPCRGDRR
jgi:transglutaminase-like putative cysteine protease